MFPVTVMRRMEKINSTRLPNGIHSGIFPLQEEEGRGNNVQICISKVHTMKYLTLYLLCGILSGKCGICNNTPLIYHEIISKKIGSLRLHVSTAVLV